MEPVVGGSAGAVFVFVDLLPGRLGMSIYHLLVEGVPGDSAKVIFALTVTLVSALALRVCFGIPILPSVPVTQDADTVAVMRARYWSAICYTSPSLRLALASLSQQSATTAWSWAQSFCAAYLQDRRFGHVAGHVLQVRGDWIRITFDDNSVLIGWPRCVSAVGKPREDQ